jgi:hypothetical protein
MGSSSTGDRIYVSSSGFLWGDIPVSTYDSGCLRSIVWRGTNRDIFKGIPPAYAKVGAVHELDHVERLEREGYAFHREVPMAESIQVETGMAPPEVEGASPGRTVLYTGRCDFLLPGSVDETKATFAPSSKRFILDKGSWKVSHLAQLVGYLWQQEFTRGRIVVGVYSFHPEEIFTGTEYRHIGTRYFEVRIADDGQIFIDSKSTPYYVQDQLAHVHRAAQLLAERKVWHARPLNWNAKWGSPCGFCPFKNLCDRYESGLVSEADTFTEARQCLKGDSDESNR